MLHRILEAVIKSEVEQEITETLQGQVIQFKKFELQHAKFFSVDTHSVANPAIGGGKGVYCLGQLRKV